MRADRKSDSIETIIAAIDYIEDHLTGHLGLDAVADAVHYSKYYLHRAFTNEVGLTIHDYAQRRRLTEAAKLLVFSDLPILEIALMAGYESRQAFTSVFKAMYKKTPNRYREEEEFYPLQLRYLLTRHPDRPDNAAADYWQPRIGFAAADDIPAWMELVRLVVDGFPYLNEEAYAAQLREYVRRRRALIIRDEKLAVGVLAFCAESGSIDFLGVHPQYRRRGIAGAFLQKLRELIGADTEVAITTFREGDRADPGYRSALRRLGFAEAELMVEYGYPTQRLVLRREMRTEGEEHGSDTVDEESAGAGG